MDKLTELIISGLGVLALTFIGLYLRRMAEDSRNNAESINSVSANVARIHNQIIEQFVTKNEFRPLENRVGMLERDMTQVQEKVGIEVRR